jgi:hypothetical protein
MLLFANTLSNLRGDDVSPAPGWSVGKSSWEVDWDPSGGWEQAYSSSLYPYNAGRHIQAAAAKFIQDWWLCIITYYYVVLLFIIIIALDS